jgi:hypothetical protein
MTMHSDPSGDVTTTRPKIVCLCGSTRFSDAFREANLRETLAGNIVLTIGCDMRSDALLFADMTDGERGEIKAKLDALHLEKIKLADEVLILNVNGYVGESTLREWEYAIELHKPTRWLEPHLRPWHITARLAADNHPSLARLYDETEMPFWTQVEQGRVKVLWQDNAQKFYRIHGAIEHGRSAVLLFSHDWPGGEIPMWQNAQLIVSLNQPQASTNIKGSRDTEAIKALRQWAVGGSTISFDMIRPAVRDLLRAFDNLVEDDNAQPKA